MSLSLKEQLIKAGLLKVDAEAARPATNNRNKERANSKPQHTEAQQSLATAYQAREAAERKERVEAQQRAEALVRERKARRLQLKTLVEGKALNLKDAEHVRYFEYGTKIRRIYVSAEQLAKINLGELGIVQLDGRFLLLEDALVAQAQEIAPELVALHGVKSEPDSSALASDYADPKYQVPDDLKW